MICRSTSCRVTWIKNKAEFISDNKCLFVLRSNRTYTRIYTHDLLIAKLAAYGLDINSLALLYNYLNSHYKSVKIGSRRSTARKD